MEGMGGANHLEENVERSPLRDRKELVTMRKEDR
jgi:hypothetical protein